MGAHRTLCPQRSLRGIEQTIWIDNALEPATKATMCWPDQDFRIVASPSSESADAAG